MRVVYIAVGRKPEVREIDESPDKKLDDMKELVGGYIEMIRPFYDTAVIVCNEEGKINGLPLNRSLLHPETGELYEIIAGNFFICDAPPDGDDLEGLSDKQIETYMEQFKDTESFKIVDGRLVVIKNTNI